MLKELQKDSSQEAYNQRIQIAAAVNDPRYGMPELEETRYVIEAAKKLSENLLTGKQSNLKIEPAKKNEIYPAEVEALADDCWHNIATIPEPDKHVRPQCALVDESGETIPKRLQVLTTDEAYQRFQEDYSAKVKQAMKKKCDNLRSKHTKETEYNEKVNKRLDRMENMFPSNNWFSRKMPGQTKMNTDHTTGLCKDCCTAQVNYATISKYAKSKCQCKSVHCPNWTCLCSEEVCSCDPVCQCDDCVSCQVTHT